MRIIASCLQDIRASSYDIMADLYETVASAQSTVKLTLDSGVSLPLRIEDEARAKDHSVTEFEVASEDQRRCT